MGFLIRTGVFVMAVAAVLATLYRGVAEEYDRGLLIVDIKKKELGWVPPEHVLKNAALTQLYLLDRYGLRAFLAFEKYPQQAELVYGLLGDVTMFHAVIDEWGEHYTIPILAESHETTSAACLLREGGLKILKRIEHYFTFKQVEAPAEFERMKRVSCTLLMLYEEGPAFRGPIMVQKGLIEPLAFRRVSNEATDGLVQHRMGTERVVLLPQSFRGQDIGTAARDMADIGITATRRPDPLRKELTLLNVIVHTRRFFLTSIKLAPVVFGTAKKTSVVKGFAYVMRHDPAVFSSGIAKLSMEEGSTLRIVQFFCWALVVGVIVYPIALPLYLAYRMLVWVRSLRTAYKKPLQQQTSTVSHDVADNGEAAPNAATKSDEVKKVFSRSL